MILFTILCLKRELNWFSGSYSDSPGVEVIRRHVADYIERRDGGIKSDWQNVVLCAGASEGIRVSTHLFSRILDLLK